MRGHYETDLPDVRGRWACLQITSGEARVATIGRLAPVTHPINEPDTSWFHMRRLDRHPGRAVVRTRARGLEAESPRGGP